MNEEQVIDLAEALFQAEANRIQMGMPTETFPAMDLEDAYAVQSALIRRKLAAGRTIRGWKIGLTSRAMQQALNITTPDSGVLFDDMFFNSGDMIPKGRFIQPRVETEIAFLAGHPITGTMTREQVLAAIETVAPALEILDTRVLRQNPLTGATRKVGDTIADNAANAGIVLGTQRHAPEEYDLRWVGAITARNGTIEETGLGAGVLSDPVESVLWLARRLGEHGQRIAAGDWILSGSFIRPIEARPGDLIAADFGAFGQVTVSFA